MAQEQGLENGLTRRDALRDLGVAGLGMAGVAAGMDGLLAGAAQAASKTGSLKDIDHVVIFMQENRSFDHYFGTLSGVRGFADKHGHKAFFQRAASGKTIHPFHLSTGCLPDITHDWGPQHHAWDHGRMDHFLSVHEKVNGRAIGPETMGYYKRSDLHFYYALADAFTICDAYHCSVIGPTDPNRLMSMSASIDPAGKHGGPLVETLVATRSQLAGHFTWPTMPQALEAHGVSWKVYTDPGSGILDNVLPYFKAFRAGTKLHAKGVAPTYPGDFLHDLAHNRLPQVSWLLSSVGASEHPGFSTPVAGETVARQIVEAILSHPKIWAKTALFMTWDENGGFFDHVAPRTPHKSTKGEFLTVSKLPTAAQGVRGPIGLGFRVPMLVISPFTRGGLVCSDVFDHTSTLRFLETRFGVKVPNLTAWRRHVTGDLTSAFNFAGRPRYARPRLAKPHGSVACPSPKPVSVPKQPFPRQEKGRRRRPRA